MDAYYCLFFGSIETRGKTWLKLTMYSDMKNNCEKKMRLMVVVLMIACFPAAACDGTDEGSYDDGDAGTDTTAEDTLDTAPPDTLEDDTLEDVPSDVTADATDDAASDAADDAAEAPADGTDDPWPDDKYVSIHEVYELLLAEDPDMLLLNVSDVDFYTLGHIPGSLAIPWDVLSGHLDLVDSDRHVVIYCRRGVRSESAYATLVDAEYTLLWVMSGGLEPWIEAEYPTVPCEDTSVTCL